MPSAWWKSAKKWWGGTYSPVDSTSGGGGGGAASWAAPSLLWNGDTYDTTPDILIDYDDPLENDVITIERCADGNGFLTVTTWTHTVTAAEILSSTITHDLGTWSDGNYDVRAKVARAGGTPVTDWSTTLNVTIGDIVAPSLTSPSATKTGSTTATGAVTTDKANGTLYWVLTTSATPPSAAQVKAGQNDTGAAAAKSGSQAVSATGVQNLSYTALTAATTYYAYYMHEDASSNQSNVAAAASFTTDSVSWSTIFTPSSTLNANNTGWGSKSIRVVCTATGSGSQMRVTLTPPSTGNSAVIAHVSAGIWSANQADVAATPVEAKFGGASGVTLTAGGSVQVSDAFTLSVSGGDKVVIIMDVTSGDFRVRGGGASNVNSYYKTGSSWTSTTFSSPTSLTGWDFAVSLIEAA